MTCWSRENAGTYFRVSQLPTFSKTVQTMTKGGANIHCMLFRISYSYSHL